MPGQVITPVSGLAVTVTGSPATGDLAAFSAATAITTAGSADFKAAGLTLAAALQLTTLAGGAAGNFTVTGIAVGDRLVAVTRFLGAGVAVTDVTDITGEFTITGANTINNGGGTNTTGDKLQVLWVDVT